MRAWVLGAIAAIAMVSAIAIGLTAQAQAPALGGNGPPPRPMPKPPPPRPQHAVIRHRARLVLYSRPHFQGHQVTLIHSASNFQTIGFSDRAMSLRAQGRWRVCEHANYRGRCITVHRDRPTMFGFSGQISSARSEGGR